MRHLRSADLPIRVDELGEAVAVDGDALLGDGEVTVHAEKGGEHAGRLVLAVCLQVGQRCAVQVLDLSGYLG
ncbi:hypothetical protein [Streptomyces nigrescens]